MPPNNNKFSFKRFWSNQKTRFNSLWKNPYYENERNLAEKVLIIGGFVLIISSLILGVWRSDLDNKDNQKFSDLNQIVKALDLYYENSGIEEGDKKYPIAVCTHRINSFDYDWTLRRSLTGLDIEVDQPMWINPENFPNDKWGKYENKVDDTDIELKCLEKLVKNQDSEYIFPDLSSHCVFDPSEGYRNCYLYTSSQSGDSYKLAYYSQSMNTFFIFSKYKNGELLFTTETI